jgi:hypothetical protein
MARLRFRDGDQRHNGSFLLLALGAVAGVALGMVLAERAGGVRGLRASVRGRLGRRSGSSDDDLLESMRLAHGAEGADYHDEFDEFDEDESEDEYDAEFEDEFGNELTDEFDHDHGDGMSAMESAVRRSPRSPSELTTSPRPAPSEAELEARVLEVFRNDPLLRGQAIDIGAIGNGTIELTGWVKSAAEVRYASTLAGGVLDVLEVMDSLAVRGTSASRVGAARTDR